MYNLSKRAQRMLLWVFLILVSSVNAQDGKALCQVWWDQVGTIDELDFSKPSVSSMITALDRPQNVGDNYGTRIRCLFKATVSGAHQFILSGDGLCELWLSTDSSRANLQKVANVPFCTGHMETDKYPEQNTGDIVLTAGQSYYLEVIHKERTVNDHLTVQFRAPGISLRILDSTHISFPTETNAPTVPGALAMTTKSDRVVALSWSMSTDDTAVAAYEIFRDGVRVASVPSSDLAFRDVTVSSSTTYSYTVRAVDVFGNASAQSSALAVTTDVAVPDSDGDGLTGCYYNGSVPNSLALRRIDAGIDFDWGTGSPSVEVNTDNFCVLWDGYVVSRYSQEYTFSVLHDDGVRLFINGVLVVNDWGTQSATESSGKITLEAGRKYTIRMEYFDSSASAGVTLHWESLGQPREVIPASQLHSNPYFQSTGVEICTGGSSFVSPAWVEGKVGTLESVLTATVNGASLDTTRIGTMGFYLTNSSSNPGISLNPTSATSVSVTAGSTTMAQDIVWAPTLLNAGGSTTIRRNDALLLGVNTPGTTLEIDVDYDSEAGFLVDYTGATTDRFAHTFGTAGSYSVAARVDGTVVGVLTLTVVGVDFHGPVACEIGFRRTKDISINPVSASLDVAFDSAEERQLTVSFVQNLTNGVQIHILPLEGWDDSSARVDEYDKVLARLGENGPVLQLQQVDTFEIEPAASKFIGVVEQFEDGSMLVETEMQMTRYIPNLLVKLHIFVSGVTFPDSTLDYSLNSSDFTFSTATGKYVHPYQLIAQPGISTGTCHTVAVYQNGVKVGQ